jgi:hypothetical protein
LNFGNYIGRLSELLFGSIAGMFVYTFMQLALLPFLIFSLLIYEFQDPEILLLDYIVIPKRLFISNTNREKLLISEIKYLSASSLRNVRHRVYWFTPCGIKPNIGCNEKLDLLKNEA